MRTRTKIILDEWFARFVVVGLNICARILGQVLRIDHTFKKNPRRIVVCKFLGMGSIIQSTPLLQTLRKNYPDANITFLTSAGNETLLKMIPAVDEVLTINDKKISGVFLDTLRVLMNLWKKKADIYIDLETYSYYSTVVATLSCAVNRIGFYRAERNIRMGVYTHMMFFNARSAIAESYLQMVRLIGCTETVDELYKFVVPTSITEKTAKLLRDHTVSNYIVINPNASDLRIERRWPAAKYVELIRRLFSALPDCHFVLIGNGAERPYVDSIFDQLDENTGKRVLNLAGRLTLVELFSMIDKANLVVTNDTGPMHISFALQRPTVALFGPASPAQFGRNKNVYAVYKNVYCSPCVHDFLTPPCLGDNQCMKQITLEEVLKPVLAVMQHQVTGETPAMDAMHYFNPETNGALGRITR